ncbi:MAG TPA: hypothetical protein VEM93_00790, partial [Actinomycetota bacterium]|nr:hypothetical protein [Actinomycetota bacterium]
GPLDSLGFYALDSKCDDTIDHDGSHDRHFGNNNWWQPGRYNHSWLDASSHSADTPLEHLGYHLAWYIYDHYTVDGQTVDLVGHSMGGLIIRYALTKAEEHDPDFPPGLLVEDIVTLETPHGAPPCRSCAAGRNNAGNSSPAHPSSSRSDRTRRGPAGPIGRPWARTRTRSSARTLPWPWRPPTGSSTSSLTMTTCFPCTTPRMPEPRSWTAPRTAATG